jgi:hypothetical protein
MLKVLTVHQQVNIDEVVDSFQDFLPGMSLSSEPINTFKGAFGKIKKILETAESTGDLFAGLVICASQDEFLEAATLISRLWSYHKTKNLCCFLWLASEDKKDWKKELEEEVSSVLKRLSLHTLRN